MPYTPNLNDPTQPADTVDRSTAAAEFRAFKAYLNTTVTIASATTPDIFNAAATTINYTGTAVCTGFVAPLAVGEHYRILMCGAGAQFTASANLIIDGTPSGQTLTTVANTILFVFSITNTATFRIVQVSPVVVSTASALTNGGVLNTPSSGNLVNCTFPVLNQSTTGSSGSCTGNSATATHASSAAAVDMGGVLNTPSSGNLANCTFPNVPTATYATNAGYATTAGSATTAGTAANTPYSGLTGVVPTWNQNTTGSSASCTGNAATATTAGTCSGNAATASDGLGKGQNYASTTTIVLGTVYTNTTSRAQFLTFMAYSTSSSVTGQVLVNGNVAIKFVAFAGSCQPSVSLVIPPGATYQIPFIPNLLISETWLMS
jgi:hypothetical protein